MVASVSKAQADDGARPPRQVWRPVGMTFALPSDVHFNADRGEATWVLPAGTFTGLDTADRLVLSDWLDDANGIDTVMDFSVRPWNVAGARGIFGVFEVGKEQATWLIVRDRSGWILVRCSDGFVSDLTVSLLDILGLIDEQRRG
jgi:hypothetical protein